MPENTPLLIRGPARHARAMYAVVHGLRLSFTDPQIRGLSIRPWLIGILTYIGTLAGAVMLHGPVLSRVVSSPAGFWGHLLYGLAWTAVAGVLLMMSVFVSIVLIMVFASLYQGRIAVKALARRGVPVPPEAEGLAGLISEGRRSVVNESVKLLWLLPLGVLVFALGFIPILLPFTLFIGAWLLGYQFLDVVLDVMLVPARGRLAMAMKSPLVVVSFGGTLALLWVVPLLGILLAPAAVAGAASLIEATDFAPTVDAAI